MLIVQLCGGLGSQLCQYLWSVALAEETGIDIQFDAFSSFANDGFGRRYRLMEINPRFSFIDEATIKNLIGRSWTHRIKRAMTIKFFRRRMKIHRHQCRSFDDLISLISKNKDKRYIIMRGDWPELRAGVWQGAALERNKIRDALAASSFDLSPISEREGFREVSVHLRQKWGHGAKGYIGPEHAQKVQPHLAADYYRRAIDHLNAFEKIRRRYLIYGDSPEWAEKNLSPLISPPSVMEIMPPSEASDWHDLIAIGRRQERILSNSSFCRTAAHLFNEGITIAPKDFFHDPEINRNANPPEWITL